MGVWERINIGAWLLWVAVLAVALLRRTRTQAVMPEARRLPGSQGEPHHVR